jgi:hypothetical protein
VKDVLTLPSLRAVLVASLLSLIGIPASKALAGQTPTSAAASLSCILLSEGADRFSTATPHGSKGIGRFVVFHSTEQYIEAANAGHIDSEDLVVLNGAFPLDGPTVVAGAYFVSAPLPTHIGHHIHTLERLGVPLIRSPGLTENPHFQLLNESQTIVQVSTDLGVVQFKVAGAERTVRNLPLQLQGKKPQVLSAEETIASMDQPTLPPDVVGDKFYFANWMHQSTLGFSDPKIQVTSIEAVGLTVHHIPTLLSRIPHPNAEMDMWSWLQNQWSEISTKPFTRVTEEKIGEIQSLLQTLQADQKAQLPAFQAATEMLQKIRQDLHLSTEEPVTLSGRSSGLFEDSIGIEGLYESFKFTLNGKPDQDANALINLVLKHLSIFFDPLRFQNRSSFYLDDGKTSLNSLISFGQMIHPYLNQRLHGTLQLDWSAGLPVSRIQMIEGQGQTTSPGITDQILNAAVMGEAQGLSVNDVMFASGPRSEEVTREAMIVLHRFALTATSKLPQRGSYTFEFIQTPEKNFIFLQMKPPSAPL